MPAPKPSELAFVPFVSVENMMRLVNRLGVEAMIAGICDYLEQDFRRWEAFDKTPRVASHSREGVIELMPTSDGEVYGFKYVNGHPKNMSKEGLQTVTAFGLLADVYTGYPVLLSEMTVLTALRTAATSALAAKTLAPKGTTHHGDDRQWRPVRVPGAGAEGDLRHRHRAHLRHRPGGDRQGGGEPQGQDERLDRRAKRPKRPWKAPRSSPPAPPTSNMRRS